MQLTIILAAINGIVFFMLSFGGITEDTYYMLENGAMYVPYIMENGEYYRLFTSMFLHFGFSHLLNNMVTLLVMGRYVEPIVGKVRLLILYFVSGLGGNLLSYFEEITTGNYTVSAGASGAIFGITGALFALTIIYRGRIGHLTPRDMAIMVGISLYLGFASEGVDNLAHIGGLICGFLMTVLMVGLPKMWFRRQS